MTSDSTAAVLEVESGTENTGPKNRTHNLGIFQKREILENFREI